MNKLKKKRLNDLLKCEKLFLARAQSLKEESKTILIPSSEATSFDWANAPASGADGVCGRGIRSLREQN